ncbi:hypothetical protein BpHYR1_011689 [Brachionus plicatilis]|uniref:Uncharacterized protein n=1 Tax=Brachionus plicatilis TaxID=10195 RepID=A0A3M7RE01_BRAPC|nr:hypothetical protein BpHYR1_011689 [Brachionus plicatilis]
MKHHVNFFNLFRLLNYNLNIYLFQMIFQQNGWETGSIKPVRNRLKGISVRFVNLFMEPVRIWNRFMEPELTLDTDLHINK